MASLTGALMAKYSELYYSTIVSNAKHYSIVSFMLLAFEKLGQRCITQLNISLSESKPFKRFCTSEKTSHGNRFSGLDFRVPHNEPSLQLLKSSEQTFRL